MRRAAAALAAALTAATLGHAQQPAGAAATADPAAPSTVLLRALPGLPARAAALLVAGGQGGPIPVSALAVPVAAGDGILSFVVVVDVGLQALSVGAEATPFLVAAYAVTPAGAVAGAAVYGAALDPAILEAAPGAVGLKVMLPLPTAPGPQLVRVLVRTSSGAFGLAEAPPLVAPDADSGAFLGPPVFTEPAGAWLLAVPADGPLPDLPVVVAPGRVVATRPLLVPATTTTAAVATHGLAEVPVQLRGRFGNQDGVEVGSCEASVLSSTAHHEVGLVTLTVSLALPTLAPGVYSVELATPGGDGTRAHGQAPFVAVPAQETDGSLQAWLQLVAEEDDDEAVSRRPRQGTRDAPPGRLGPRLRDGYETALRALATAGLPATRAAVVALEGDAFATARPLDINRGLAAELDVARRLAKVAPQAALALALLHTDALADHEEARDAIAAAHGRRVVEELAVLYAETADTATASDEAAAVLAGLGAACQGNGLHASAERLFRRSLLLSPGNAAASLGLAAGLEQAGVYRSALRVLEALLEREPTHPEGRLRAGINHVRVGSEAEGLQLLRACAAQPGPPWVRTVANQELAARALRNGKVEEAEGLLRAALAVAPDDPHLTTQLARALDRLRRPAEAAALASRLLSGTAQGGMTPRFRYAQWPGDDVAAARARLQARRDTADAALLRAVAALPGREPRR